MRKYNKKEKKKLILSIALLLTIAFGIGYALLTEQLKLNGSVNYGAMSFDVGFTTAEDGGGSVTSSPSVSTDKKSVTVTCNVGTSTSSETCIAKAKIKNASSFAVQLDSNPTITYKNTYINSVTAVWSRNSTSVVAGDSLGSNVEEEITITISTKELTKEMLPETTLNIPITITMDWVETGGTSNPQITYEEKQLDSNVIAAAGDISALNKGNWNDAPFVYMKNLDLYSGKKFSKIGIPVKSVAALDGNQTFTLSVFEKSKIENLEPTEPLRSYELKLPVEQLGDSTTVNKWVYVDLKPYNIVLTDEEILGFGRKTDTIGVGFRVIDNSNYAFYNKILPSFNQTKILENPGYAIYYDLYYIEEVETTPTLQGKKLSVLGDSISTFYGVTDSDEYGYAGHTAYYTENNLSTFNLSSVNDTWWMQTVNNNGMVLEKNNSWGGAWVVDGHAADSEKPPYQSSGMRRAEYLGNNPDVIAVFLGTNDLVKSSNSAGTFNAETYKNLGTEITDSEVFVDAYSVMVKRIEKFYPNSNIFLFTLLKTSSNKSSYNEIIRAIANYSQTDRVYLVDLDANLSSEAYSTHFGDAQIHPNATGMDFITETFENSMKEAYGIN